MGSSNQNVSGRVSALAIDPNGTMFLGAAGGGIWKSTNFTQANPTWTPVTDNLGVTNPTTGLGAGSIDVGSIAVDPNNGQVVYTGTGEADNFDSRYGSGILKSTDGGNTFSLISSGPASLTGAAGMPAFFRHSISKIIVDPTNPTGQTLYAAVVSDTSGATNQALNGQSPTKDNGIYKSTDGGATWTILTSNGDNKIGQGVIVTDLDYTLTGPNGITLYAGVATTAPASPDRGGIYSSTDGGINWIPLPGTTAPTGASVGRVRFAADHTPGSSLVYAAVATPNSNLQGVYKITNNGATTTALTIPAPNSNYGV